MAISVFDLFTIGIGPSSSHTVGPMRAARSFIKQLKHIHSDFSDIKRIQCDLFGSLGHTGKGHGSDKAIILGLLGEQPHTVVVDNIDALISQIYTDTKLNLDGTSYISFSPSRDIIFHRRKTLPKHPNGMTFSAFDNHNHLVISKTCYSVGGGFVVNDGSKSDQPIIKDNSELPLPFKTGAQLIRQCEQNQMTISQVMMKNESALHPEAEVKQKLLAIWDAMNQCIQRGCENDGILPGGLKVQRRARTIYHKLIAEGHDQKDSLYIMDWVNLYALAVNEENAAGGRVVTAPTNGAAGILPAVLKYFCQFRKENCEKSIINFLLTAGAIAILYKENASISGAEVGCQGEVGVACSMAAGALTEILGGSPLQVENAAEIGMEHNLGLTCDPIGGLVQIPCIERNAMASIKAINASRLALRGDGGHKVSLDKVIKTMKDTGADMQTKYKETARGGLAVNIIEC